DRNRSHWSTSKTPSYTKSVSWQHHPRERLKDLPNMSFHLEAILGEVGIKDVRALRILGAKMCWLRLRQQNSLVTEKILFMLEGAIIGIHEAALPVARRQELAEWADSLTPKQEFPAELE
ncbi:TfoX/Sxy family protein, partial [Escherichia coli]|uniref:TfoX/Sxy family protein n=1 Tax=Escherichia coli TaxID=562 RepID=UPI0020282CCF